MNAPAIRPDELAELIGRHLSSLTGKAVSLETAAAAPAPTPGLVVAEFSDDDGAAAALCCCELRIAAFLGAAPTGIPPGVARESIDAVALAANLADGFREVMNVLGGVIAKACARHVVLGRIWSPPAEPPAEIARRVAQDAALGRWQVAIAGYGDGRLALLAAPRTAPPVPAPASVPAPAPAPAPASAPRPPAASSGAAIAGGGVASRAGTGVAAGAGAAAAVPVERRERPRLMPDVRGEVLASHLVGLLGREVEVRPADELAVTELPWAAISAFLCDDGEPAVVCLADLPFAAASACALAGLDPQAARDACVAGRLDGDLADAYREVMNVVGGLLNTVGTRHVVLRFVHASSAPLPRSLPRAVARSPRRFDFAVRVRGFEAGRLLVIGQ